MKKYFLLLLLSSISIMSCGQKKSQNQTHKKTATSPSPPQIKIDSAALLHAFQQLQSDNSFLKELGLAKAKTFSFSRQTLPPIWGDLNQDGNTDALVPFTVEGRGGGNNWDAHYAVFLQEENKWKYKSQIDAGGDWAKRILHFSQIKGGRILGNLEGNSDKSLKLVGVEYHFINGQLTNTFMALHQGEKAEREYLEPIAIITDQHISLPLLGTVKNYETVLGKGKKVVPESLPDCGYYFEEGEYSELHFPTITLEVSGKKAAVMEINFSKAGFSLLTDKGTLRAGTTLKEVTQLFFSTDSYNLYEEENGDQVLGIPNGEESDEGLRLTFDKKGKLLKITRFIPC